MPTTMEKAAYLLDAQHRCTLLAQAILGDYTARAYCSPRFGPIEHVHVTINEGDGHTDDDIVAYFDSENEEECWGEHIPNTGLLHAGLLREFPGVSLSIVVCY